MKFRLESAHNGQARHGLLEALDGCQIDRVVQCRGSQVAPHGGQHGSIHQEGSTIIRAAVHGFERDGVDLDASGHDARQRGAVIRHAFQFALGQHGFAGHFENLIFERRRAEIRYQQVHSISV
jgi:hypothetical protein